MVMGINIQTNGNILLLQAILAGDCHFFNMKTGIVVESQNLRDLMGEMKKPSIYLFNHSNGEFYGIQVTEEDNSS